MMRSTFAGFTTGQLAMAASQRAIDVTGQNIANINTEGYTQQRLDIASLNLRNGSFYNSSNRIRVGYGVDMTGVSQLRDPFLDAQYRSQIYKLGTTDAHAAGLEKLQVPFDEAATSGVRDAFLQLSNALQTLSKDDGYTKENDTVVRSRMQILVNLFREKSTSLQDIRKDTQDSFKATDIKDLNETLKNIANLNTTIKNSQVLGNPALELMDERNLLLDELASYLPIDVKYSQQHIGEGYTVQVLDVTFTDTEGNKHFLVSDGRSGKFSTDISRGPDGNGPVTLTLTDAEGYTNDITDKIGGGTLKGTLDFLNKSGDFDDPPSDFKGIGYYEKVLDSLVEKFATEFNNANKTVKVDADGKPVYKLDANGDKIEATVNGQPVYEQDREGDYLVFNTPDTPPTKVYQDVKGNYFIKNANNEYEEIPDTIDTKTLEKSYDDKTPVYEYEYVDNPLFETRDGSGKFTADNIKIAQGWMDGTYGITNTNNVVNDKIGSSGNENILNMIDMLSKNYDFNVTANGITNTFYNGSFFSCFANIESTLAIDMSSSTVMLDNQITVLNQTSNSRDAISGVQLDEEGMNLLHYNQSYSAAARLITTLDEMLDKLINGTGVVGR
ncbi:MAG: flagellar hook-associated protein FlgK [Ruminococcus sp.]|jgi:flagellar hook-associated protein 1 FlgK|nr:flagellar hook-associated protein FlgK [Ruminococcus sp.]